MCPERALFRPNPRQSPLPRRARPTRQYNHMLDICPTCKHAVPGVSMARTDVVSPALRLVSSVPFRLHCGHCFCCCCQWVVQWSGTGKSQGMVGGSKRTGAIIIDSYSAAPAQVRARARFQHRGAGFMAARSSDRCEAIIAVAIDVT